MEASNNDWVPVKKGHTFCSPACSYGCTSAEHKAASKAADDLATRMGHGWRGVVWENCGWHYRAVYGPGVIEVYPNKDGSYWASIGGNGNGKFQQYSATGDTPEAALAFAVAKAREGLVELANVLKGLNS